MSPFAPRRSCFRGAKVHLVPRRSQDPIRTKLGRSNLVLGKRNIRRFRRGTQIRTTRLFSPKGWNKSAQGNALGTEDRTWRQALKGRDNLLSQRRCYALSGLVNSIRPLIPRALPWADLFEPFRLQTRPSTTGRLTWCRAGLGDSTPASPTLELREQREKLSDSQRNGYHRGWSFQQSNNLEFIAMTTLVSRRDALRSLVGGGAAAAVALGVSPRPAMAADVAPRAAQRADQPFRLPLVLRQDPAGRSLQSGQGDGHPLHRPHGPRDWPTLKKYGLTCAMANGAGMGIDKGFNRVELTTSSWRALKI